MLLNLFCFSAGEILRQYCQMRQITCKWLARFLPDISLPTRGLSEVIGIMEETVLRNMVSDSRIVTPNKSNVISARIQQYPENYFGKKEHSVALAQETIWHQESAKLVWICTNCFLTVKNDESSSFLTQAEFFSRIRR